MMDDTWLRTAVDLYRPCTERCWLCGDIDVLSKVEVVVVDAGDGKDVKPAVSSARMTALIVALENNSGCPSCSDARTKWRRRLQVSQKALEESIEHESSLRVVMNATSITESLHRELSAASIPASGQHARAAVSVAAKATKSVSAGSGEIQASSGPVQYGDLIVKEDTITGRLYVHDPNSSQTSASSYPFLIPSSSSVDLCLFTTDYVTKLCVSTSDKECITQHTGNAICSSWIPLLLRLLQMSDAKVRHGVFKSINAVVGIAHTQPQRLLPVVRVLLTALKGATPIFEDVMPNLEPYVAVFWKCIQLLIGNGCIEESLLEVEFMLTNARMLCLGHPPRTAAFLAGSRDFLIYQAEKYNPNEGCLLSSTLKEWYELAFECLECFGTDQTCETETATTGLIAIHSLIQCSPDRAKAYAADITLRIVLLFENGSAGNNYVEVHAEKCLSLLESFKRDVLVDVGLISSVLCNQKLHQKIVRCLNAHSGNVI
eukprot:Selendium_serpulae@DN5981_c0_g1_i2.p1